jgi:hypothetical protein
VAGNWSNAGTLNARTGTVTLNGTNQKIFGSTTFYKLTKDISGAAAANLYFQQSKTQTIAASGTLTLKGASGKALTLRSCDGSGTLTAGDPKWGLSVNNTGTTLAVDYVDVKDSNASAGKLITQTNSTNSGNNLNWDLPVPGCIGVADVPMEECQALMNIYDTNDGISWANNTHWAGNTAVTGWYGVTVADGHVTMLKLSNNLLTGGFHITAGNLNSLTTLELYDNALTSFSKD